MKKREMLNVQVPICKVCQGALSRVMVYRDDYKGHLYFCKDCGTEYKIIGQGQAENELLMEYEKLPDDITQRIRGNSGRYDPSRVVKPRNCMECENSHITIQNGYCRCKLTSNCYSPIIMADKISEDCPLYKGEK